MFRGSGSRDLSAAASLAALSPSCAQAKAGPSQLDVSARPVVTTRAKTSRAFCCRPPVPDFRVLRYSFGCIVIPGPPNVLFRARKPKSSTMLRSRLKPLFPAFVLGLFVAQGAHGVEFPQELIDCRAIASATARLGCYDQLADAHAASANHPAQTGTAEEASPAAAAVTTAATATTEPAANFSQEALFGKSGAEIEKSVQEATGAAEINQIEARVSKIKTSATGYAVITLDNGQVWKQTDRSRLRLSGNDQVTIRRAALGSFMLRKTGRKTIMRVKRIS